MCHANTAGDTLKLAEFEIKANYVLNNQGFKRIRLDSVTLLPHINANLSTILSDYTTIFIKTYGNNTLSTPTFRGTTSQHTQVEWNGISLNSPMLGQIDLSQIPVSQFDKIEILYGAAALSQTSGAFGGVVNLVTVPDWNNLLDVVAAQTIASFDNYTTNLSVVAGNRSFQSHTKAFFASGLNDFSYYNDYLLTTVNQVNNAYKQLGFAQEIFWRLNDRHLFSVKAWYNQSNRELPPTTTSYNPDFNEKQDDRSIRAVMEYKYIRPLLNLSFQTSLSDQFMHYFSPAVEASHQVYTWANRFRFSTKAIKNLTIKPGIEFNYDWAISDSYEGLKTRSTTAVLIEATYGFIPALNATAVIRQEMIDGNLMPLIASLGMEYKPLRKENLAFSGNVVRNYRFPTLNELYWKVMGNPDLKPESNLGFELGTTYNRSCCNQQFFFETTLTGYSSWITDMIVWTPVEGNSSLWKPENVNQVWARGVEAGLNLKWRLLGFDLSLRTNYTYCRSTYEKASSENDRKEGKQLIYTPEHSLNSAVDLERWRFYLRYNFLLAGKRFTSTDNLSYMPAYNLSDIIFGKEFILKDFCLNLQIEIKNLFNLDYQSIASRPMPGINYALTLKFSFHQADR